VIRGLLGRLAQRPPKRVLVAIPTIDRDAPLANLCHRGLAPLLGQPGVDLLVVTRASDAAAQAAWRRLHSAVELATVPDYPIDGRHNHAALADKRNLARRAALDRGYDELFFVDADVELRHDTYDRLAAGLSAGAAVAFAPYAVRWYAGQAIVGVHDPATGRFAVERVVDGPGAASGRPYLGGLGCALVGRDALDVPIEVRALANPDSRLDAVGEDFGFYLACHERGKQVCYVRQVVTHHVGAA
jgi:hypothetical protein